jgi:hypothetical protein
MCDMPHDKLMKDTIVWKLERMGIQKLLSEAYEEQNELYVKFYKDKLLEMYGDDRKAWLNAMVLALVDEYYEYLRMEDEWEKKYELVDILHFILQMFIICHTDINKLPLAIWDEEEIYNFQWLVKHWLTENISDEDFVELMWLWFLQEAKDLLCVLVRYHFKAKENERRQKEGY